ncbi:flagellar basal body P-ring formation chaperone FlgA [Halodesulfovibrio marinisediminis]|uniref:Flagella basal body P-ring formation protein FlgA n=1 Tax=Halodesulfovibrio marinisediminis DSM 17456 TaxID=1121457 RepID=A0A1N6J4T8_9BACT|nr:flagellar basal body P-ring formation chaperone FlgA [Halodesulfovibrio marinisediminis]SIO39307.1 flagella basal body P-ring formation protein FlgA [Halodesulfovibrio marinisediminis DSM 17456]
MRILSFIFMKRVVLCCMAVCMLSMVGNAAASETKWHFTVLPAAVVTGDVVLLGDIAKPSGDIAFQSWQNFAKIKLWPAPRKYGRPMSITRPKLRNALQKYLGGMASKAILPGSIAIQRGGKVVQKNTLSQMVTRTISNATQQLEGEAVLRDMTIPNFIFLRDSKNRLDIEPLRTVQAGRIGIRFREIDPTGQVVRRITGGAFLDLWVTVPCAAIPLNRNELLTPDSITHERKNLAYLRGEPWDGRGGPYRVTRTLGAGTPIFEGDLEGVPVVVKGSRVELVYKGSAIRLSVTAKAMEDGRTGEVIPVRNLQSKRQVYATVLDDSTVIIERNR